MYESDSRDNLEINLGYDSIIAQKVKKNPQNTYYSTDEEMFLIKILNVSKPLRNSAQYQIQDGICIIMQRTDKAVCF